MSQNLSPFNQTSARLKKIENITPETVMSIYEIEVNYQLNTVKLWG